MAAILNLRKTGKNWRRGKKGQNPILCQPIGKIGEVCYTKGKNERGLGANEKIILEKFVRYINKVYGVARYAHQLRDNKSRRSIKTAVVAYLLLFAFALEVSSFNKMTVLLEYNKKRFHNLFPKGTRLPKIDALRETVKSMWLEDVLAMYDGIIDKAIENKVLRENTINGLRVAAVDGVELFSSKVKCCEDCLTREVKGEDEYFHKAVVCMTVGCDPHIALGVEMLGPKNDGSDKDEGEMTGVKRLLTNLHQKHYHFADVIVADALYMNAPFLNLVTGIGMDAVVRAKDERLNIVQDALGLFKGREPDHEFHDTKKQVWAWDEAHFHMNGYGGNIRFLKFVETWVTPKGKEMRREAWCITTLGKNISAHTVWLIMRKRWHIENNGFRMLKTYFHADHNYVHGKGANEKILLFILMAFNLMELFLFRRLKDFREKKIPRYLIKEMILWELDTHNMAEHFACFDTG